VDSLVSSQLILNIFEKNTPLHDGAVLMSGNRIRSATCYLPLSDNMNLSKALGTRHRAAVGISEVSDSLTIVVSEETGSVSVAKNGRILRNLTQEQLREQLVDEGVDWANMYQELEMSHRYVDTHRDESAAGEHRGAGEKPEAF